jgi:peptide/nickel transport system permease protein
MLKFIATRLAHTIPVLIGVSFIVFASLYLAPGDIAQQLLGMYASPQRIHELRQTLGLDRPLLIQYGIWLRNVFAGDLGVSPIINAPVFDVIRDRIVNSLILLCGALAFTVPVSVVFGALSAANPRSLLDRFTVGMALVFAALPVFWLGLVLLYLFSVRWSLLPTSGMYDVVNPGGAVDLLRHLVMPAFATAVPSIAVMTRVTRASMIQALSEPYIAAARARGFSPSRVTFRHAFRNVLPQYMNMLGLNVGFLFGGALFTEVIFNWPGIGTLLYESILSRDVAVVQGCVLAVAIVFVLANLCADVAAYALDPKKA